MSERLPAPKYQGRFVCLACHVELRCVRIGVWLCPRCGVTGPLTFEDNGFSVIHVPPPGWNHSTPDVFRRARLHDVTDSLDPERATP